MSLDRIEIESLVLRAPIAPADARELAAQVATEIHRRLHMLDGVGHVELGHLRLRIPTDAPRSQWASLIATRLIESLVEGRDA